MYNACLQQRIEAYRHRGLTLRYGRQAAELRAVREAEPALARWSFTALQQVLRRAETTYTAFLQRKHGFPRFHAASHYHAAALRVGDGLRLLKTGRIGVVRIPGARLGTTVLTRQQGK